MELEEKIIEHLVTIAEQQREINHLKTINERYRKQVAKLSMQLENQRTLKGQISSLRDRILYLEGKER